MANQQLQTIIDMLRAQPRPEKLVLAAMRAGMEAMVSMVPETPDVVREPVTVGGVPAEWVIAPNAARERAVLYLHGGGYVVGSINTHRDLAGRVSRAAQARVLLIAYQSHPRNNR